METDRYQGSREGRLQERQHPFSNQEDTQYSGERGRVVYLKDDSAWVDQQVGSESDSCTYSSREEAIESAQERLRRNGGGELIIRGRDGNIEKMMRIEPGGDDQESRASIGRGTEAEASFGVGAQEVSGGGTNRPVKDKNKNR